MYTGSPEVVDWQKEGRWIVRRQDGEFAQRAVRKQGEKMRFSGSEHTSGRRRLKLRKCIDRDLRGS